MRNYTFLKSIFICLFVAFTSELSAQAGIGVFSRHLLNPNGEIAIGISERNSLDFIGAGIEYRRNVLEHNLYSFIVGVNLQKMKGEGYTAPPGVFFQVNWKIFKTLIDQEKWTGFFSAGPRLFYVTQSFEPEEGSNDFPIGSVRFGFEGQVAFNLNYKLNENFTLTGFVNGLSTAFSISAQEVDNPILTPRQRRNGGFDIDVRLLNELRIGVMYNL